MKSGNIVEYIDHQKIVCAVVLEIKEQRLRLVNEANREVSLSEKRLSHACSSCLNLSMGRDRLIQSLKEVVDRRNRLAGRVDIKELWEILETEQEWIDLATMTEFCFPGDSNGDNESAVIRAFFQDRLYFKFSHDRFFPNSKEKVKQIEKQIRTTERQNRTIEAGVNWLKRVQSQDSVVPDPADAAFMEMLQSFYLFGKESPSYALAKSITGRAGIDEGRPVFDILVKAGVWDRDENIDLKRAKIPVHFSEEVIETARNLSERKISPVDTASNENFRKDLTDFPLITIDAQSTLDFDDALSIEKKGDDDLLGVHIADAGHLIKKRDIIDQEAGLRGTSMYMPDQKVPMLPSRLAEELCCLKIEKIRPAISLLIRIDPTGKIRDVAFYPSWVRVKQQLTYQQVDLIADHNEDIIRLYEIAKRFRKKRLADGAVQITLPEITVRINEEGDPSLNRINRESPGRMLVSELMIMANWLAARFLAKHHTPAIFRSQPAPRDRLYHDDDGTLFQNWMQRKCLSRFVLSPEPDLHAGLGLDAYVTATSPIRRYFDLVTQRQIRAALGIETPYSKGEIEHIIQTLGQPLADIAKIQNRRHRYWLLKYLEKRIGKKEEAIVLGKRRNGYLVLLTEYMLECHVPLPPGVVLKPEDLIEVTIQQISARNDTVSVFMS